MVRPKTVTVRPPKVAVIIPTFNRWPVVCEAIDSVLAQTYPATECVVVDDASSDATVENLERLYGRQIRLIALPTNGEKSAARNAGVRVTDAAYVSMLDSDDLLTPTAVQSRLRLFLADSRFAGVAYGHSDWGAKSLNARAASVARNTPGGGVLEAYVREGFIHNNAILLPRGQMLRFGMYREDMTNREDVELIVRLAACLEFRCSGSCVTICRRRADSARTQYDKYIRQGPRLIDHLGRDAFLLQRLGKSWDLLQFQESLEYARAHYKSGRYRTFRSLAHQLLKRWPGRALRNGRLMRRLFFSCFRRDATCGGPTRHVPKPNVQIHRGDPTVSASSGRVGATARSSYC
jgi:glycosyltransferase involved in cell wall biosynthesis